MICSNDSEDMGVVAVYKTIKILRNSYVITNSSKHFHQKNTKMLLKIVIIV